MEGITYDMTRTYDIRFSIRYGSPYRTNYTRHKQVYVYHTQVRIGPRIGHGYGFQLEARRSCTYVRG